MFYNLDAIIAVGYRINCKQATQFRRWATSVLKEFIIKGFVLNELNQISTAFLDMAENRARRHITTTMDDWRVLLHQYMGTMNYTVGNTTGTVSHEQAIEKAHQEYDRFRLLQDKTEISDFDKYLSNMKDDSLLPFDIEPNK